MMISLLQGSPEVILLIVVPCLVRFLFTGLRKNDEINITVTETVFLERKGQIDDYSGYNDKKGHSIDIKHCEMPYPPL